MYFLNKYATYIKTGEDSLRVRDMRPREVTLKSRCEGEGEGSLRDE